MTNLLTNKDMATSTGKKGLKPNVDTDRITTTTSLAANDVIVMTLVPSNCIMRSIKIANTDLDTNGTPTIAFHIGIHTINEAGTLTAVDNDFFSTAVAQLQSASDYVELINEAGNLGAANKAKRLYDAAGVTTDPKCMYAITMTISTGAATIAAGTIAFEIEYLTI